MADTACPGTKQAAFPCVWAGGVGTIGRRLSGYRSCRRRAGGSPDRESFSHQLMDHLVSVPPIEAVTRMLTHVDGRIKCREIEG